MLSQGQFAGIHAKLASDGGFTVNPRTGEAITKGISVAPAGNERVVSAKTSGPSDLASYHAENTGRFDRGASLGGWRHQGSDYYDTPTVYPNTPGGESRSRNQMLASNQIASFNLEDFSESFNPFHSENRGGDVTMNDTPQQRELWKEMPRAAGRAPRGEVTYRSPDLTPRRSTGKRGSRVADVTAQDTSFT